MDRRFFLKSASGAVALAALGGIRPEMAAGIDRRALVARHSPVFHRFDSYSVLSVGNGRFVYTADISGLQTFPDACKEIPLATQAEWGWHSFPNPENYRLEQAEVLYDTYGRKVPYASNQRSEAGRWLRESPHKLSLARIGFDLGGAVADDLQDVEQRLDLWTGMLESRFRVGGLSYRVFTCVHPDQDALAVRVEATAPIKLRIDFPYGAPVHTGDPADWSGPDRHRTEITRQTGTEAEIRRTLDADTYHARATWSAGGSLKREGAHSLRLSWPEGVAEFVIGFAPDQVRELPARRATADASASYWQNFWSTGGAIDLSGSTDPRAMELERRIVLSQYLTAIQCSGSIPPQETGLTFNSWHGKHHLEMHWWHAAHFPLWGRTEMLARSLPWYIGVLERAKNTARHQGYEGARWPKMVGPDGRESPSGVGPFLIWQQPHPIYLAELVYRARPDRRFLDRFKEVVFESARFMASYPVYDETKRRFVLGPPLIPAQELHKPESTFNPTFELSYWRFGLETAQTWRQRLGLPREPAWDRVLRDISPLPVRDGLYLNAESDPETFTNIDKRRDHPTLLGALGFVPSDVVDPEIMRRTLRRVMKDWQWDETWGWDYPLVAMTAARVGEPEIAIDALMMETQKNRYHPNGHNYQRPGLTIYLPGNGGLLFATAMMAAGWDGYAGRRAPGFPSEKWRVQWEGLRPTL